MSSPPVTPGIISSLLTAEYCCVAALSLVTYDWLIRFDDEIRCFWNFRKGRKLTAAALVYGSSRYLPIIQLLLTVRTIHPLSDMGCQISSYIQSVASILLLITPAIFSALRVYALSGRSKTLAGSTFLLLSVPFGINLVDFPFYHIADLPSPFNCSAEDSTPEGLQHTICAIIGDVTVLVVTWWNTFALLRLQQGLLTGRSMASVILYNGSIYFIAITALNLFQMVFTILNQVSGNPLVLSAESYVDNFISPITNVLICHFLLNLRQAGRAAAGPSGSSPSAVVSLQFAAHLQTASLPAFIASIGGPVHTSLTTEEASDGEVTPASGLRSRQNGVHGEGFGDEEPGAAGADINPPDVSV